MGVESNSASVGSLHDMPTGTESEMLRIGGAQLYLLDEVESVRMETGDFALIMIVQAKTPLATVVAQVAEFQWPIGKDAPVLKIANFRYTFAMPGLLYGLILPDNTSPDLVQRFESHLRQYSTFEIRPEIARAAGVSDLQLWSPVGYNVDGASEGARYWTAVNDDVEGYSGKLVRQMQSGSKVAANSILKGGEWATWGIRQGGSYVKKVAGPSARKSDGEEMSPRMRKRVDQARRMSAVAKLLSRTVLKGAVSATGHVANFLGMAIGGVPPVRALMSNDARREVVVASVDAFAQVVEAVETAGKSLAMATGSVGKEIVEHKFGEQAGQAAEDGMGAMGNMIDSMWTLNKLGLYMLWRATTASTVINYGFRNGETSSTIKSSSPAVSNNSVNTMRQPSLSMGRSTSQSTPMSEDDVPRTAQLFPNSPGDSQPQFYAVAPPLYMHPPQTSQTAPSPAYASYYHTQTSTSPFRQYTRPSIPPTVQPFFPHGTEAAKPQ